MAPFSLILVLIAYNYARRPHLNANADAHISSGAKCLKFDPESSSTSVPCYASSEGSGESAHLRGLPEPMVLDNVVIT